MDTTIQPTSVSIPKADVPSVKQVRVESSTNNSTPLPKMPSNTDISRNSRNVGDSSENTIQNSQDFLQNPDVEEEALEERIAELVDELNAIYNPLNLAMSFGYNEDIQALYVEIKRKDNGEVLRQIPSEDAIRLMTAMREMQSAIFDTKA